MPQTYFDHLARERVAQVDDVEGDQPADHRLDDEQKNDQADDLIDQPDDGDTHEGASPMFRAWNLVSVGPGGNALAAKLSGSPP